MQLGQIVGAAAAQRVVAEVVLFQGAPGAFASLRRAHPGQFDERRRDAGVAASEARVAVAVHIRAGERFDEVDLIVRQLLPEFVDVGRDRRMAVGRPQRRQLCDVPRFGRRRHVQHLRQEGDAEKVTYRFQRLVLPRQEIFIAYRQHALPIALHDVVGGRVGGEPGPGIEQRVEIVDDGAVHRRHLRTRIAHHVQEQHVRIQPHDVVGVVHAVERLVHHHLRLAAFARAQQQLPCHAVDAARLAAQRLEHFHRIEGDSRPLDHADRRQAHHIDHQAKVGAVVAQVAVQGQQRHHIDQVQGIR